MKPEYFVFKQDGTLGWIEKMPKKAELKALQSAIDNAIEVSNPDDVLDVAFASDNLLQNDEHGRKEWKVNSVYPLTCRVGIREVPLNNCKSCNNLGVAHCAHPEECGQIKIGKIAHVTFPEDKPDYVDRYKKIVISKEFQDAYKNKSIGIEPEQKEETQEEGDTAHWMKKYEVASQQTASLQKQVEELRIQLSNYAYQMDMAKRDRDKAEAENLAANKRIEELFKEKQELERKYNLLRYGR